MLFTLGLKYSRRILRASLIVFAALNARSSFAVPTSGSLPTEIRDRLIENARGLGPVTITWKRERTSVLSPDALLREIGLQSPIPGDESFVLPEVAKCLFSEGRLYIRYEFSVPDIETENNMPTGAFATNPNEISKKKRTSKIPKIILKGYSKKVLELSFDGNNVFTGDPTTPDGKTLIVMPLDKAMDQYRALGPDYNLWRSDYWHEAGYRMPKQPADFSSSTPAKSELFMLTNEAGATVNAEDSVLDGRKCMQISIQSHTRKYVFSLDKQLGYAIRRCEELSSSDKTLRIAEMHDFLALNDKQQVWLPQKCKVDYFQWPETGKPSTPSAQPLLTEVFSVTDMAAVALSRDQFVITYETPGTYVADGRIKGSTSNSSNKAVNYRIPANPADLEAAIENAKSGKRIVPSGAGENRFRYILVAINVAIIIILIFVVMRYRRTAKR